MTELVLEPVYTQEFTVAFQDEGELLTFQVAPADGQALPEWLKSAYSASQRYVERGVFLYRH